MIRNLLLGSVVTASSLYASDMLNSFFEQSEVYGNVKYYYIQTDKQNISPQVDTSASANSIGGKVGIRTGSYNGVTAQATLMTTNGFSLGSSVDTSILGRDNGVRVDANPSSLKGQESFTIMGEAFLKYSTKNFDVNYGRQVLKSPLVNAKEVRLLPSAVQGTLLHYSMNEETLNFEAAYLTDFKHRTSNKFINIIEHALGEQTQAITGSTEGSLGYIKASWKDDKYAIRLYNYYAQDFLNSFYSNISYKTSNNGISYGLYGQGIIQRSIGNADTNLALQSSITGGKKINAEALSFKATASINESNFMLGYAYVTRDNDVHDNLVLPWDGTPLYTNMITSNNLFVSNYGRGLTADSVYIGGTQSLKIAYTQGYDFTGVKGFKTTLSYMLADNNKFIKGKQKDFNIVLGYKYNKNFSIDLKGMFVTNNTSAKTDGTIAQLDDFQQYRIIMNYKF